MIAQWRWSLELRPSVTGEVTSPSGLLLPVSPIVTYWTRRDREHGHAFYLSVVLADQDGKRRRPLAFDFDGERSKSQRRSSAIGAGGRSLKPGPPYGQPHMVLMTTGLTTPWVPRIRLASLPAIAPPYL